MNSKTYFRDLASSLAGTSVTDAAGRSLDLQTALDTLIETIAQIPSKGGKLIFIGNGGSAAIASHQAVDYWKNGKIRAVAFNDASLLTCISNDYGYSHVFEKPIEMFAQPQDMVLAISSSGRSENILKGVSAARQISCHIVTFSGFDSGNPLRTMGDYNFYIASHAYGTVEIAHLTLLHYLLDRLMELSVAEISDFGQVRGVPAMPVSDDR